MEEINWVYVVLSTMSTVATVAAAYAALTSLRISRQANQVSEKSILAAHHSSAAFELSSAISKLKEESSDFSDFAYSMWADWPRDIEGCDDRSAGGIDPRPLRHVLTNASEMLVGHGTSNEREFRLAQNRMFSIIRDGVAGLNELEFNELLKKADHEHDYFESIFGTPSIKRNIGDTKAFRWVCYQLTRRVGTDKWQEIWIRSWHDGGWMNKYRTEFSKIQTTLSDVLATLRRERGKIALSVYPLKSNPVLDAKYNSVVNAVEVLLDDCNPDLMEAYSDFEDDEDAYLLIVYSMGIAYFAMKILGSLHLDSDN
ncbi:hypothetical protein [Pseudohongiella sp.]|uniref:Uncharacterized protein n=1 Tax=marine sediment metagenome TaxID=412755 RepID=A0A0F9Z499_9ZZZZ|nr:hypothetical protein [Pseudohongiella sp.]HDZ07863.1 hypothetical protein [Pseudohongiella sp.]HEA61805.1 hypothetical protein [Pseudohongiella sp.]